MIPSRAKGGQALRLRQEGVALGAALLVSVAIFIARRMLATGPPAPADVFDLAIVVVAYATSTLFIEHPGVLASTLRRGHSPSTP